MKMEISIGTKDALGALKNKLLLLHGHLYAISDFKIEEEIIPGKKTLLGNQKPDKKQLYLTDAKILSYNDQGRFMGALTEDATKKFIRFYNLYALRDDWENFQRQLEGFGMELKKKQ